MTEQQVKQLLSRYSSGEATADEVKLLENWYLAVSRAQKLDAVEADFGGLKKEIWLGTLKMAGLEDEIKSDHNPERQLLDRIGTISTIWKIAAAVAAITLGVWLYNISNTPRHPDAGQDPGLAMNDIAPGKNTATLTLANGKTINLDTSRASVVVTDSVKITTMLTASTPRGGTYQFTLPDGTRVWLNADSKIEFPSQFYGEERKVLLVNGEAYFEVAKDKQHSFIVASRGQEVTVLGTHFNINAYKEEGSIKTTLLEGSVRVSSLREGTTKQSLILRPGQQAALTNNAIGVNEVNPNEAIAWKNGKFMFNDESLESIMRKIARWYDVDVVYSGIDPKETFGGSISRFENVSKVLKKLEMTGGVQFKIEGRRIIVSR